MSICTFFGHRDAPLSIKPEIVKTVSELIVNGQANKFYVGNQGNFDRLVLEVLRDMSSVYTHIKYNVVLAYIPLKEVYSPNETIVPEGIECVPRRFAISYRNKWMVDKSDYVVTYITRQFGGAAKFKEYAEKKNKNIISLSLSN